ncbi:T9SS type A sorting domain-containing protein [Bacteroidota bacterium]
MKNIIILLVIFTFSINGQERVWNVVDKMTLPVAGGREWVDKNNIYILGGYSDSTQSNIEFIQKYSTFLRIWKKKNGKMHQSRYGFVADRHEENVYFLGGVHENNAYTNALERWSIGDSAGIVQKKNSFNRIFSTGLIHEGIFYIIGGNRFLGSPSNVPYIIEYDISATSITYESPNYSYGSDLPEQQMSEIMGENIFIFGGVSNSISQKIYKYNTSTHNLELLSLELLEPRASGRAVRFGDKEEIYILGGYNEEYDAIATTEIFSIVDEEYKIQYGPNLRIPRHSFMAAYLNEEIYVLGGFTRENQLVPEVEKLMNATDIESHEDSAIPESFELLQNYPNPFNPITKIKYNIKNTSNVTLKVFDIIGNEVVTLVDGIKQPGTHEESFDGRNLASGIYLYKLISGEYKQTKKMLLLK